MLPLNAALPPQPPPGIGLFDLDGTLLAWDCQLLFRHFVVRRAPWRIVFLPLFLVCAPFHRWLGDARLKRVFLSFLAGLKPDEIAVHARDFAARVVPTVYPELRDRVAAHRRAGHLLILASASPEFYVREIGAALDFDLVLGTPVELGSAAPLLPPLENHKGGAKVRRLEDLLPASYFSGGLLVNSHGYTDSRADLPMLAVCHAATVVNPSPALAALAAERGWEVVRPSRPWRSPIGRAWRMFAMLLALGRDPGGLGGR